MTIVLKTISFRNFMSFGNATTTISLETPGTTLITGKNIDKGGSSGSGKTSIINAICYALYDKTPNNIGKERLINSTNNAKNTLMEVILDFERDEEKYRIRRTRGETSSITIFKDEKDITPDSVVNTNRKIEEIIGISYDLFCRVVLFSGNARPFLDLPVHEQRTLIEELLKITMLSQKAVVLKDDIKATEKDIDLNKIVIKQQEAQNQLHKKHVAESELRLSRWEEQREKDVKNIESQLSTIANINWEEEEENHQVANALKNDISKLALIINPLVTKRATLQSEFNKLVKEKEHLANDKCPYCLQKFADAGKKLDEIETLLFEKKSNHNQIAEEISVHEAGLKKFKDDLNFVESVIKHKDLSSALKIRSNMESLTRDLERLRQEVNPHIEAYESLLAEKEIVIDYEKLNDLNKTLEHQKFLLKLLTDKNSFIRKRIISKTIPFLNKRILHYVGELGLPHTISFLPDMSCEISEFGRQLDHGNLSAGEQKRLNLSLSLAFRDVLTHLHLPINTLFTDEVDGGSLDTECVDMVIRLLKHKAWDEETCIFIISHRPEFEGRCDHNIVVSKENGFSTILETEEAIDELESTV
jgi:DNA repair exonuclease SbcCD ATPase subunit